MKSKKVSQNIVSRTLHACVAVVHGCTLARLRPVCVCARTLAMPMVSQTCERAELSASTVLA